MTKKITELDPALPLTGAEVTPLVQNAVTRRSTLSALADWVLRIYGGFTRSAAGGVVTDGANTILNSGINAVASDIGAATVSGGGTDGRQNVIGGNVSTVDTPTDNVTETGTQADYSVITGGYDNVASGLMSVISGAHSYTKKESTHGTISGGSRHKIDNGDYHTIAGGTLNKVDTVGGSRGTIGGGSDNLIQGTLSRATIAGGGGNTITGTQSTIGGGLSNTVSGTQSVIAGGTLNEATAALTTVGGGSTNKAHAIRATVGGGFTNTASAEASTVPGGANNTASAISATVGGGQQNAASSENSTVAGGNLNTASQSGAVVSGGKSNTSSQSYAVIAGGFTNTAGANYTSIIGGANNAASGVGATVLGGEQNESAGAYSLASGAQSKARLQGQRSHSSGRFSASGDAQTSSFVLRRQTTDAVALGLRVDGGSSYLTIPDDTTWAFRALVVARRTDADNESAAYQVTGCIDRNAGVVALVGTPTITVLAEDAAAWNLTCSADDTNKALVFSVTGEAGKTIRWVATVETAEVTG
jgi:hypothetical protein